MSGRLSIPDRKDSPIRWQHRRRDAKDEHGEAGELSRIDIRAGMAWLKNAASLGTKEAANQVGDAYMPGQFQEFPKIYGGGLKWQRMAAELGQADAAFKLGVAYCCGAMPYNETQITT